MTVKLLLCLLLVLPLMHGGEMFAGGDYLTVTLDGETVEFEEEAKPFIDEYDRTQTSLRFISEDVGADVEWDGERRAAIIVLEDRRAEFVIGQEEYTVNGESREMDTAARIVEGRTFTPPRFVANALDLDIDWVSDTRTVALSTVDVEEPRANLEVEKTSYGPEEVIELEIENTGNTPITFERDFWVEYLVAERDDEESLLLPQEPVTKWFGEEEIPDDWLMRRRNTEDKLAVGEFPGEELDAGFITGGQEEIPISWVAVELERLWPDEPTILEPGETETQSFIPEVDFEEEAMNGNYRVVKEFSCEDTGEDVILHDNFRIDIDTGFEAALEMKDKEFTPTEEVEFEVINTDRTGIEFARPFGVARYEDGDWVEVELDMAFTHDIVSLNPGETFQQGFIPEEGFADPEDVVEGNYIVTKLVWCSETDNSKVVVDEFRFTEEEEEEVRGNSTGNLVNYGLAAKQDGWIYHASHPSHLGTGGVTYKVRPNGSERTKISEHAPTYINVMGDWVYYRDTTHDWGMHLYRMRTDGSDHQQLAHHVSYINVVKEEIYYAKMKEGIYKMTKDNDDYSETKLVEEFNAIYLNVVDGWIYYSNRAEDGNIYKVRTDGTDRTQINSDDSHGINVVNDWIYYRNFDEGRSIYKVRTDGTDRTRVNEDFSASSNVAEGWIYYSNRDDGGRIYKMRTDGSERTALNDEFSSAINLVDDWIIYAKDNDLYKMRTDGSEKQPIS